MVFIPISPHNDAISYIHLSLLDFGIDRGFNYNNAQETKPCITARSDSGAYTNEYPMAVYYAGQKVVIAHPLKVSKYLP